MPASTAGANNSDKDDPVYAQSTFLTSYMSNHTDVLVAYILNESLQQQQRKEKKGKGASTKKDEDAAPVSADAIKEPRMMKITSREMVLEYKDAKAGKAIRTVTVPFDPPLLAYDEVRPRLTQMKLEAEANIGMDKTPQVLVYRPPSLRMTAISMTMITLWLSCATTEDPSSVFSAIRNYFGGWWVIKATGMFIVAAHSAEAAFQYRSCTRFSVPMVQTILWTLTTFVLGFPGLLEFRKVVREARVRSLLKKD